MPNAHQIGQAITFFRYCAGLERTRLAEISGVSYEMIAKIEQGKKKPSPTTLLKLAQALQVPADKIMTHALTAVA